MEALKVSPLHLCPPFPFPPFSVSPLLLSFSICLPFPFLFLFLLPHNLWQFSLLFLTFLRFILFNCPSLPSSSLAGPNMCLLLCVLAHIPTGHSLGHVSPASVAVFLAHSSWLKLLLSCALIHLEVLLACLITSQICLHWFFSLLLIFQSVLIV